MDRGNEGGIQRQKGWGLNTVQPPTSFEQVPSSGTIFHL